MSLELFNSLATFGTFLVIAATAIAALFQLRHARSANLIEAYNEVREMFLSEDYRDAQHFVVTDLWKNWQDPAFRYQFGRRDARTPENQVLIGKINTVGNTFEQAGLMTKRGLVDREMIVDAFGGLAITAWTILLPVTAAGRRAFGEGIWENFEYFVVLSQDWVAAHSGGAYPRGIRRISVPDELREADEQYAAALATA